MERARGAIWKIAGKLPVAFSNRTAGAFMFSHAGGLCRVQSLCFLLFGILFCVVLNCVALASSWASLFRHISLGCIQIFFRNRKHKFGNEINHPHKGSQLVTRKRNKERVSLAEQDNRVHHSHYKCSISKNIPKSIPVFGFSHDTFPFIFRHRLPFSYCDSNQIVSPPYTKSR